MANGANRGGIVKRSVAMVFSGPGQAIAKACGLDDATQLLKGLSIRTD